MAILGSLLKRGIKLRKMVEQERHTPFDLQNRELRKLLTKAQFTEFGRQFNFEDTLRSTGRFHTEGDLYQKFRQNVPVFNYNKIYKEWWHRTVAGEYDICWPGRTRYFALSSGTSE